MRKDLIGFVLMSLLIVGSFAPFASAEFSNPTNSWQASNPTLDGYYSGSIDTYWPILNNLEDDNCEAVTSNTDFIVYIPAGGCSPDVVRSDLLAEQNVPVFCQLSAIKVNPLIDVSTIKSISFKGDYPDEVAGISFHPSRAAISSTTTLSGDPVEQNIGYVVIVLDKVSNETSLEEQVSGILTASISYDANTAFGTGAGAYYLETLTDGEWNDRASDFSFWGGKGYLRAKKIEDGKAVIDVMSNKNVVIDTVEIAEGNISKPVYYPGQYCTSSIQLKLNSIDASENSARLNIDGDNIWVKEGTRLFDGKCVVSSIDIDSDGSGSVKISCGSQGNIDLTLGKYTEEEQAAIAEKQKNEAAAESMGEAIVAEDKRDVIETSAQDECDKSKLNFTYGSSSYSNVGAPWTFTAVSSTRIDSTKKCKISEDSCPNENEPWHYTTDDEGVTWTYHDPNNNDNDGVVSEESEGVDGLEAFKALSKEAIDTYKCLSREDSKTVEADAQLSGNKYEGQSVEDYFELSKEVVLDLVESYPYEQQLDEEYWGEDSLYKQILLAGKIEDSESQIELINLFLNTYPESSHFDFLKDMSADLQEWNYQGATESIALNNGEYNIRLEGLRKGDGEEDSVNVRINDGRLNSFKRNRVYDSNWQEIVDEDETKIFPRLKVSSIGSTGARFTYYWEEGDEVKSDSFAVAKNEAYTVDGIKFFVNDIIMREVASISLIPNIKNDKTETNFTFNIGIEKRAIKLNPEKAQEKIDDLNKTISAWQDRLETLGNVIKGMKTACLGVSGYLSLKNVLSGFDGASIARTQVMDYYEDKCRDEGYANDFGLGQCYSEYADDIEDDVDEYSEFISKINDKVTCANTETTVDSGLFGGKVVDSSGYVAELSKCAGIEDTWSFTVGGVNVRKKSLSSANDYQAALLYEYACNGDESSVVCEIATSKLKDTLVDNADRLNANRIRDVLNIEEDAIYVPSDGNKVSATYASNKITIGNAIIEKGEYYKVIPDGNYQFIYRLEKRDTGTFRVVQIFKDGKEVLPQDESFDGLANRFTFVGTGEDGSSCKNRIDSPYVRYYESANVQGFAGVIPFDLKDGWYAYVQESGYTESGEATEFYVCNVGSDKAIDDGPSGGDICVQFRTASGSNVLFSPCPTMSDSEVKSIYDKAQAAIREANRNGDGIYVDGVNVPTAAPLGAESTGLECTDFMSVKDCNLMFNVCDPVTCPTSRCDMGGKYPVSDVVSSGIIGSIALCLPNFESPSKGGVLIPVCLSGIHAGIDSYLSVLESHMSCLESNIETGEYTGICDEISAVYTCDFFWGQVSPLLDNFLPNVISGGNQMRGGAEYLTTSTALDNLEKSVDFFQKDYSEGSFAAFNLGSTEEIGTSICKNFVGTSLPTSASLLDELTDVESPSQFYAQFSESVFSEATVPSTSHYKVYYHIYAGNDEGAQYKVYLKNPPESSYYANRQTVEVSSGYVAAGGSADKSEDFTAPSGYKELCVSINGVDECGFEKVTTDFGIDFVSQAYAQDQASTSGITSTEDCTSTVAGAGSFNLNAQEYAESALGGDDIATTGITRICASANPTAGVSSGGEVYCTAGSTGICDDGYECEPLGESSVSGDMGICENGAGEKQISEGRWKDVGYCDDENVRCWLDTSSVGQVLSGYSDGDDSVVDMLGYDINEEYESVDAGLNSIREAILELSEEEILRGSNQDPIFSIMLATDYIAGVNDNVGEGLNVHKAEALAMKAELYRVIAYKIMANEPETRVVGSGATEKEVSAIQGKKDTAEESKKNDDTVMEEERAEEGFVIEDKAREILNNGEPTGVYVSESDGRLVLRDKDNKIVNNPSASTDGNIDINMYYSSQYGFLQSLHSYYEYDFESSSFKKKE